VTFVDVWAITWRYYDGSGSGVVRVHADEALAERDLKMLQEHANGSMRQYDLQPTHLVKNRRCKRG
jgi:hypothetical protein